MLPYVCPKCRVPRYLKNPPRTTMCRKCAARLGSEAAAEQALQTPAVERFDKYWTIGDGECWNWQGTPNGAGYGSFLLRGEFMGAHRASYELRVGPIPEGLEIDHLCRNRRCVNPDHLEVVTRRENWRRSSSPSRVNAKKVICINSHPLSGENLYVHNGKRYCRECRRRRVREAQSRKRQESVDVA